MNVQKAVKRKAANPTAPVEQQLVAAVERAELRHEPFDHIYMEGVLDPEPTGLAGGDAGPALLSRPEAP